MRLPWLQVDQDGLTRCKLLARLLGVPETQGIGIGMAAWQWALEIAPDDDFRGLVPDSGILAAAVGWPPSDAGRLITEMQRVGLVATAPTLRVRGLDRYRRAWEKNRRKPAKSANSGSRMPESGASSAGNRAEPARQTQTQTQTQKKRVAPAKPSPPEVGWQDFVAQVEADAPGYAFDGREAKALKACLAKAKGDREEVRRRWRRAWASTVYPLTRSLRELDTNWGHFATDTTPKADTNPEHRPTRFLG